MSVKFSVPIIRPENRYTHAEITKPSGATLADTRKAADTGDFFSALRVFCIGCIQSITSESGQIVEDKTALKSLISKMPFKTAEQLSFEIIKLYNNDDDAFEGCYPCPRCHTDVISELKNVDGMEIDTRDFLSDLQIGYYEGDGQLETILSEPIKIKNKSTDEVYEEIISYTMHFPTLEDGISAFQRVGSHDVIRLQYAMFLNAIEKIDSEPVTQKWKNTVGMMFFEAMKDIKNDVERVATEINNYGVIQEIEKTCPRCGKIWMAPVNTSNFFASALRPM